jgi:hypothetical protein
MYVCTVCTVCMYVCMYRFFLCGDDTFLILENLKQFLAEDIDIQRARAEGRYCMYVLCMYV